LPEPKGTFLSEDLLDIAHGLVDESTFRLRDVGGSRRLVAWYGGCWRPGTPRMRGIVTATLSPADFSPLPSAKSQAEAWFAEVEEGLAAGRLAPYLGPGVTALASAAVPTTQEALAAFLGGKVTLPRRARGNLGAAAQYIESQKHRKVVAQLMAEAFATPVAPLPIHHRLARLPLPLVIDTWYDGAMRAALGARTDWGEIQGIRRSGLGDDAYYAAYDARGAPCRLDDACSWKTLLYKPHGATVPAQNFLVSDSDYVEVLTEIDIQTPIPPAVKERRAAAGYVFLGCRFDDQTLRSYARQLLKRSGGRHFVAVDPGPLTRNERRFIEQQRLNVLVLRLSEVVERLSLS